MTEPARDPLSPFFPNGALRLLYWVFFAPSHLRAYVKAIAPEHADAKGLRPLLAALRASPPLRRFLPRALAFTLIAPLVIDVAIALASVSLGGNVDWFGLSFGVAVGMAVGVAFGVARGVAFGVAWGVAWGVAGGVAGGVAFGVVGGVAFGVTLGVAWGVAFGVAEDMAFGVAVGAAMIVTGDVVVGLVVGLAGLRLPFYIFQLPWALRLSRQRDALDAWRRSPAHWDELLVLPQPGLAGLLQKALAQDLAAGLQAVAIVASNPFQRWAAGRALADFLQDHPDQLFPALDRLLRQPTPYRAVGNSREERERTSASHFTTKLLLAELAGQPPIPGISDRLARAFTSPWRRIAPKPLWRLSVVYLAFPTFHFEEIMSWDQEQSSLRELTDIRDELDQIKNLVPDEASPDTQLETEMVRIAELEARILDLARNIPTQTTQIINTLRSLIGLVLFELDDYHDLPYGTEIYLSFHTWARFLDYETLDDLAKAPDETAWLDDYTNPLRPDVLKVLASLAQAACEVKDSLAASSSSIQLETLTRADLLMGQVADEATQLPPPESTLAATVAGHWSKIIAAERERLSRPQAITDMPNNYIFGPPLRPDHGRLFVGRHDTFAGIRRLWSNRLRKQSLVIHGQRRTGKSSILYHLQERLSGEEETYLTVYADLQGLAAVSDVSALLYNLADIIADRLDLPRPALDDFYPAPFVAWRHLLDRVDACLDEREAWLVLMLDEFETVEAKLRDKVFPQDLLHNFRSTIQHRPRLTLVFAGCHTLEQMTRDYWGPFFGAAVNFKVGSLGQAAAQELITNPWDDFRLNYERPAIERIIQVSGGQPYLLQAVCYQVIEEMNRQLAESGPQFSPRVALTDVEGVLDRVLTAGYYFEAVWDELNAAEQLLLSALGQAADEDGRGERAQVERLLAGQLTAEALQNAWNSLAARDMLAQEGEQARFVVELVYRWVRSRKKPGFAASLTQKPGF